VVAVSLEPTEIYMHILKVTYNKIIVCTIVGTTEFLHSSLLTILFIHTNSSDTKQNSFE
jgi:hypothetical protein